MVAGRSAPLWHFLHVSLSVNTRRAAQVVRAVQNVSGMAVCVTSATGTLVELPRSIGTADLQSRRRLTSRGAGRRGSEGTDPALPRCARGANDRIIFSLSSTASRTNRLSWQSAQTRNLDVSLVCDLAGTRRHSLDQSPANSLLPEVDGSRMSPARSIVMLHTRLADVLDLAQSADSARGSRPAFGYAPCELLL
jgi:hypothetical protein